MENLSKIGRCFITRTDHHKSNRTSYKPLYTLALHRRVTKAVGAPREILSGGLSPYEVFGILLQTGRPFATYFDFQSLNFAF